MKDNIIPRTHPSALRNPDGSTQAALDLAHVHDSRHAHNLEHSVVMSRFCKSIVHFGSPRIRARTPANWLNLKMDQFRLEMRIIEKNMLLNGQYLPQNIEYDYSFDMGQGDNFSVNL